jgi:hypothetical protein
LSIIAAGKTALETTPRGENPNNVAASIPETKQQEKYNLLKSIEQKMRNAIVNNKKLYDNNVK